MKTHNQNDWSLTNQIEYMYTCLRQDSYLLFICRLFYRTGPALTLHSAVFRPHWECYDKTYPIVSLSRIVKIIIIITYCAHIWHGFLKFSLILFKQLRKNFREKWCYNINTYYNKSCSEFNHSQYVYSRHWAHPNQYLYSWHWVTPVNACTHDIWAYNSQHDICALHTQYM